MTTVLEPRSRVRANSMPRRPGAVLFTSSPNHELLAVELMAVCLLAFPDAPPAFRLGVGRTLLEEQRHLRMYRARMAALGVDLGDVPVGGHFWRVLAGMRSPLEYVTGMSMVFEQANLDPRCDLGPKISRRARHGDGRADGARTRGGDWPRKTRRPMV